MVLYNIMSCSGFADHGILGSCSQSWLVLALMFLIAAIIRRQTDDGVLSGTPFFFPGALIAGIGLPILAITLFGQAKYAFLAGLIGIAIGGFGIAFMGISGGGSE
jgi:hypothetical protein